MIYHLMPSSPYTRYYLEILASRPDLFSHKEHYFLIERSSLKGFAIESAKHFPHIIMDNYWGFVPYLYNFQADDRLIIHQFSNPRLYAHLYLFPQLIKQCIWSVWGCDVYFFKYRTKSIKDSILEHLRRKIIPKIPIITSILYGDFEVIRKVYGSEARHIHTFYPIPVDYELVEQVRKATVTNKNGIVLMVGNSGDPTNNHVEVFQKLSKFKKAGVRIISPLSYGNRDYIDTVIKAGVSIFGDKFVPLTEFMPKESYVKLLSEIDVFIMNCNLPYALGNIITMILLGKKVFIRAETTSYRYFKDNDIAIYETDIIDKLDLEELLGHDLDEAARSASRLAELTSNHAAIVAWHALFEKCRDRTI